MEGRRVFVWALLLAGLGDTFCSAALADDARVLIVSPIEGQQFAPGDKVAIVVDVAPSLRATDGSVGLAGLGSVKGKGFSGTRFAADFVIPDYYAGPLINIMLRDILHTAGLRCPRHLLFEPMELLERIAALTPRPRINLILYHGVLGCPRGGVVSPLTSVNVPPMSMPRA